MVSRAVCLVLGILFLLSGLVSIGITALPDPPGTSYAGTIWSLTDDDIAFLYDITYSDGTQLVSEQQIFPTIEAIIQESQGFVLADFFLWDRSYAGAKGSDYSTSISDALIRKKALSPDMKIVAITDPINTFYGGTMPLHFRELRVSGVDVLFTDINRLKDSNPIWSSPYRILFAWMGNDVEAGFLPNIFGDPHDKATIRSYLALPNFKANHRKVLVTQINDSPVTVLTSANPHQPSSLHNNIGFVVKGPIANDVLRAESAVMTLSGDPTSLSVQTTDYETLVFTAKITQTATNNIPERSDERHSTFTQTLQIPKQSGGPITAQLLTEKKIRDSLLADIDGTGTGDSIDIAMFYLSDNQVIDALKRAAWRGVRVRIILDANKDAFGKKKIGIPNRQAAYELVRATTSDKSMPVSIRWYNTHGEQFHSKLVIIRTGLRTIMYGGSANLTRRNLDGYNLEADLRIEAPMNSAISTAVQEYFTRIWSNIDAEYTLPGDVWIESTPWKRVVAWIQEEVGLGSF